MTESNHELRLLELGDLNAEIGETQRRHASEMAALLAKREALIQLINKPVHISISATVQS